MLLRKLLIAVAVLAAVGGLAWWANKQPVEKDSKKSGAETPTPKLLDLRADEIQRVDIKRRDAEETTLERSGKDWRLTSPKPLKADQDAANSLVIGFTPLNAERLLEEKATDLPQFGLAAPALDVTVGLKGGKSQELLIGDNTPTNSGFFAKLANDPRVFIVSTFTKGSIDKTGKDLQDKRLLTFDADKLSRIELTTHKQALEFGKNAQGDWQILKPQPMRADGAQVDGLLQRLKDARMDPVPTADELKQATALFVSAVPVAIAKVTDAGGTQTLDVRKIGDDYFAKSSVVDGAYKIGKDAGTAFDKNPEEFRNRKLFDFGFNDPDRIDIRDGAKAYSFWRTGDKWTTGGKTMDAVSVQNLIDKLRDLSAARFPDSGFTTPAFEITIVSGGGKRTEKAQIAEVGQRFIARREGEPALYELDAKAVPDLRQAAADVKESQPSKAAKK